MTALSETCLDHLAWWAEGDAPHKLEWLDDEGRVLGTMLNSRGLYGLAHEFSFERPGADRVRLTKAKGRGLVALVVMIEDWRLLAPYLSDTGVVTAGGLALLAQRPKPETPAPEAKR